MAFALFVYDSLGLRNSRVLDGTVGNLVDWSCWDKNLVFASFLVDACITRIRNVKYMIGQIKLRIPW